jgi:hypothetical protein
VRPDIALHVELLRGVGGANAHITSTIVYIAT